MELLHLDYLDAQKLEGLHQFTHWWSIIWIGSSKLFGQQDLLMIFELNFKIYNVRLI